MHNFELLLTCLSGVLQRFRWLSRTHQGRLCIRCIHMADLETLIYHAARTISFCPRDYYDPTVERRYTPSVLQIRTLTSNIGLMNGTPKHSES